MLLKTGNVFLRNEEQRTNGISQSVQVQSLFSRKLVCTKPARSFSAISFHFAAAGRGGEFEKTTPLENIWQRIKTYGCCAPLTC